MVLSNKSIRDEVEAGNILISPYNEKHVNNTSYDVTLGNFYYRFTGEEYTEYNPFSEKEVKEHWMLLDGNITGLDDNFIVLYPRETILAHTNEFIGGKNNITTMMKARSSLGRNMIQVCHCAGWGDVGYVNRWTMEISNNSDCMISLPVGMRVAQIVFMYTTLVDQDYIEQEDAKYSASRELEVLQQQWEPSMMLPKLYKDRERTNA